MRARGQAEQRPPCSSGCAPLCLLGLAPVRCARATARMPVPAPLCSRRDALPTASRRSTLQPAAGPHRLSVAADNAGLVAGSPGWAPNRRSLGLHGRRSSVAPSRLSTSAGHTVLSRLSLGLTDALQWLGIKGRIPTAGTAGGSEGQQGAAVNHGGAAGAGLALDRPALSPIASPGLDEGGESPAPPSPLLGTTCAAAEQCQQQHDEEQGPAAAAAAPTPGAATALAVPEAWQAADSPAPSETPADGEQPATAAAPAMDAVLATAGEPGDAAAVEQLGQQLAETLQLQPEDAEAAAKADAAAVVEAGAVGAEPAPEESALVAAAAEPEEELTPLQQLLVLCGQEVSGNAAWVGPVQLRACMPAHSYSGCRQPSMHLCSRDACDTVIYAVHACRFDGMRRLLSCIDRDASSAWLSV